MNYHGQHYVQGYLQMAPLCVGGKYVTGEALHSKTYML